MSARKLVAPAGAKGGCFITFEAVPYQRDVHCQERTKDGKPEFVLTMSRVAFRRLKRRAKKDGQLDVGRWFIDTALRGGLSQMEAAP